MNWVLLALVLSAVGGAVVGRPEIESARGIGSSLWNWTVGWWWPAGSPPPPAPALEVANVTVTCGDQTCTTVRCERGRCDTTTCSIYDTDTRGECREYNVTAVTATQHLAVVPAATAEVAGETQPLQPDAAPAAAAAASRRPSTAPAVAGEGPEASVTMPSTGH